MGTTRDSIRKLYMEMDLDLPKNKIKEKPNIPIVYRALINAASEPGLMFFINSGLKFIAHSFNGFNIGVI